MSDYEPTYTRMSLSSAIDSAMEHTKTMLFAPFNLWRWLQIGFIIFLASMMMPTPSCSFNFNFPMGGPSGGPTGSSGGGSYGGVSSEVHEFWESIGSPEVRVVATIVVVVLLIAFGFMVLFGFLGSRGVMMFIRTVALDHEDVGENWRDTQSSGNRLFKFWLKYIIVMSLLVLLYTGACTGIGFWLHTSGVHLAWLLVPAILLFVSAMLAISVFWFLLFHFVAPLMWRYDLSVSDAWHLFADVARDNKLTLFLYWLLCIALNVGIAIVSAILGCITCCVARLPWLSHTLLSPVLIFKRAIPLFLLDTARSDFQIVAPLPDDPIYVATASEPLFEPPPATTEPPSQLAEFDDPDARWDEDQ